MKHHKLAPNVIEATAGADTFMVREGASHITISGFNPSLDRLMFDYGSYSDILAPIGSIHDGAVFQNFIHTATWTITSADVNGDGIRDTHITVDYAGGQDVVDLLSVSASALNDWNIAGG